MQRKKPTVKKPPIKIKRIEVPDVDYAAGLKKIYNGEDDNVNHPPHYSWLKEICGVEPIEILRHMDFDLGNAMKYLLRCGRKGVLEDGSVDTGKAIEDLEKAIFYINDKIEGIRQSQ